MFFYRFEKMIAIFREAPATPLPHQLWPFCAHYLRQLWPVLTALLSIGLIISLIEVGIVSYLGRLIDLIRTTPADQFLNEYGTELLLMAGATLLIHPFFFYLRSLLVNQSIGPAMTSMMLWQNYTHTLKQSLSFFQSDFSGRLVQRVTQASHALREATLQAIASIWHVLISTVAILILFSDIDWRLLTLLIVWIIIYLLALIYFVPRVKIRTTVSSEASSKLTGCIVDSYTNIVTLKLFAHSELDKRYIRNAITEQTNKIWYANRLLTSMDITVTALNGLLVASSTGLAIWLWTHSIVTIGTVALITGLIMRIVNMSGWVMWTLHGIFGQLGLLQDSIKTMSHPVSVTDKPHASQLNITQGAITFEQVRFHYTPSAPVIDDLNLTIHPGEKIGLIGPSGAGKTTLMNLLLRFYELNNGRILIDDQDIANVTQESLRAQIGMITQDTSLLHRSLRENLQYGKPDASDDALIDALRRAHADHFVTALCDSDGRTDLDAHVGERGSKLSGGQRQRIAIARVLLKDAPILIMDEATSALDAEIEAAILESLDTLMQGKTVIAIAHRLSTIAKMDRLVVMDKGHIIEIGNHSELLAKKGLYARLWQRQTGGFVGLD
ncbi:ABC transporter ATP-binding protein [Dickeya dadantii subsp. dieffenbachiae]|uniref:ABC transporter ATP-binding protein n=1 Tax=Dickeya dadantii TaxID=204038 RepID=UPI0003A590FF|nr:ABC transporter ATP-binding protein [Dickeya dadantii]